MDCIFVSLQSTYAAEVMELGDGAFGGDEVMRAESPEWGWCP